MNPITGRFPFILGEELVPVREAQKNITKYFEKGFARVTKNGKSLGYLISDKMLDEILENIEAANPAFIAGMEAESKTKKRIPLSRVMKEYGIKS
jgi:hypothetical protein